MEINMILDTIVTGYMQENCYLAGSSEQLLVIDPGAEPEKIIKQVKKHSGCVKYIVLTHCHWDHIGAAAEIKAQTGAQLVLCKKEEKAYLDPYVNLMENFGAHAELAAADLTVSEGDILTSGDVSFRVIETPGHTAGSMCLLCGDCLFSGDTLFQRGMGRVDFPTGSMKQIISSICEKLFLLPGATQVYPGHGAPTTIEYEKQHNEVYEWGRMFHE